MNTIKFFVFIFSLVLINYVGGVPTDLKNLFITHTIFFIPYFLDLHQLLNIKFDKVVYWIIRIVYVIGCVALVGNISGIFGLILYDNVNNTFSLNNDYWLPFSTGIEYDRYILFVTITYVLIYCTNLFKHMILLEKNSEKDEIKEYKEETA